MSYSNSGHRAKRLYSPYETEIFGSSTTGPGANPLAQGAGAGMTAYSLYNNMGNSTTSSGGGK